MNFVLVTKQLIYNYTYYQMEKYGVIIFYIRTDVSFKCGDFNCIP